MGFTYLGGKSWLDVTREERLFCSYLYWDVKGKERDFVLWLNENTDLGLEPDVDWEVGYEVCFYRDLLKSRGESLTSGGYSPKRTFDLCLFSEDTIVIIEAKVQQMFDDSQVDVFQKDRDDIPRITDKKTKVKVVALASSEYFENYAKYGRHDILSKPSFDAKISWKQIYALYPNRVYLDADRKYRH